MANDIPASPCLGCGRMLDAATSVADEAAPDVGDVTVCTYCGHIMVFAADRRLRNPNDAEMVEIAGDRRLLRAQQALAELRSAVGAGWEDADADADEDAHKS